MSAHHSPPNQKKKARTSTGTVFSQPLDTGVGRHWATQLYTAVHFLKNHGNPIRLEDLALTSGVEALLGNVELLESFRNHERVVVDERTGLYSYKVGSLSAHSFPLPPLLPSAYASRQARADPPTLANQPDFVLKSKTDLLTVLLRYAPRGGLAVKTLRESWPQVGTAIDELEKEGKVFVTRTGGTGDREGQMKAVFLDEIGNQGKVDEGAPTPLLRREPREDAI
jgi:transcription initiation factor TFIIE subunit beta